MVAYFLIYTKVCVILNSRKVLYVFWRFLCQEFLLKKLQNKTLQGF